MTGQKPAAAEKNESANPVLNQSILVVTLVLTGGISTPGAVLKLWLGALRPFADPERVFVVDSGRIPVFKTLLRGLVI